MMNVAQLTPTLRPSPEGGGKDQADAAEHTQAPAEKKHLKKSKKLSEAQSASSSPWSGGIKGGGERPALRVLMMAPLIFFDLASAAPAAAKFDPFAGPRPIAVFKE